MRFPPDNGLGASTAWVSGSTVAICRSPDPISGTVAVIVTLAMAGADIRAGSGMGDMRAGTHTIMIEAAACTHRTDMRPGMHAMVTHIGAGIHEMSDVTTGADAVLTRARARAGTQGMTTHANAMLVDAHMRAHAQHIHANIGGIGSRCKQGHGAGSGEKMFHDGGPYLLSAKERVTGREVPLTQCLTVQTGAGPYIWQ